MTRHFVASVCLLVMCVTLGCASDRHAASGQQSEAAFKPLFNGKDLAGWSYPKDAHGNEVKAGAGYRVRPEDGVVYCTREDGGRLMTDKEYADFELRFEFKLTANANNGIGIRAAADGNPAYRGMEIQILDDSGSMYQTLRPAQYNGSIYDVVAAQKGHLKPVGEWNDETIIAKGRIIKIILNGTTIVDANLDDIVDEHILAKHPGLQYKTGHIDLLGHGAQVEFRNMRVKEL